MFNRAGIAPRDPTALVDASRPRVRLTNMWGNGYEATRPDTCRALVLVHYASTQAQRSRTTVMLGTLMWVGDTTATEFRDAVHYCLLNTSQIAFRRNVAEGLARPATDVRRVLFAQNDRSEINRDALLRQYPEASAITIRGPFCLGIQRLGSHGSSIGRAFDWHDWDQVLPDWVDGVQIKRPPCRTVAIVAATLSGAEPLLDLAESCGATAVWCRQAIGNQVRNVDAVWWDDSIANPTNEAGWRARLNCFAGAGQPVQHAWIATAPTHWDAQQAQAAGVHYLVSKPHRIDVLTRMIERSNQSLPRLRAAA